LGRRREINAASTIRTIVSYNSISEGVDFVMPIVSWFRIIGSVWRSSECWFQEPNQQHYSGRCLIQAPKRITPHGMLPNDQFECADWNRSQLRCLF
jgi:hypothetical protein